MQCDSSNLRYVKYPTHAAAAAAAAHTSTVGQCIVTIPHRCRAEMSVRHIKISHLLVLLLFCSVPITIGYFLHLSLIRRRRAFGFAKIVLYLCVNSTFSIYFEYNSPRGNYYTPRVPACCSLLFLLYLLFYFFFYSSINKLSYFVTYKAISPVFSSVSSFLLLSLSLRFFIL